MLIGDEPQSYPSYRDIARGALLAKFDGDFACESQTYTGTGALRCTW